MIADSKNNIRLSFEEFRTSQPVEPPEHLTRQIIGRVQLDLEPAAWQVFLKLAMLHFASGVVTLSICPQFGIQSFGEDLGLMKYFSVFGRYGCIAACGAFFVGASVAMAAMLLRPEEIRAIRKTWHLQLSLISFLSLGAFLMLNAEIVFAFGAVWLMGSVLGGLAALELGWIMRTRAHAIR